MRCALVCWVLVLAGCASPAPKPKLFRVAAAVLASPCFPREPWMTWPRADAALTNQVPMQSNTISASWQALRLEFAAQSNVFYQVQFATNLNGLWFAYANVRLDYDAPLVQVDYPVWCGANSFLRIMK